VRNRLRPAALREFLEEEATAGAVLLFATAIALIWANSAASDSYTAFWHHQLDIGRIHEDLQHWVNDGLMVVFFFVVGLEIKRELAVGELRRPRAAVLPALAALGGVVTPVLIYLLIAPGGPARHGWGVPMATDIAFAVGVLALFGSRCPAGTRLLLLSLALVDDILAIAVIAVVYSEHVEPRWLALAGALILAMLLMRRWAHSPWWYVPPGLLLWYALLESGVPATLAGVVLGLLTPARPVGGAPVLEELEHALHPFSAYLVVPLFALANAGVDLRGGVLGAALGTRLTWAIALGLVIGKTVGITGAVAGARTARIGALPAGAPARQVPAVGMLAGIGFTVALFIADLAFTDERLVTEAKVGIFLGSVGAAVLGSATMWRLTRRPRLPR
jgi:Na+:H+ antiporter, NhaA family